MPTRGPCRPDGRPSGWTSSAGPATLCGIRYTARSSRRSPPRGPGGRSAGPVGLNRGVSPPTGAAQVPGVTAVGPGAVDVELLTGWTGQARPPAQVGRAGPSGRAGHAGHAAARARVPLASARAEENGPAASGMRDLDGYFDSEDASAAAATLSPVG